MYFLVNTVILTEKLGTRTKLLNDLAVASVFSFADNSTTFT